MAPSPYQEDSVLKSKYVFHTHSLILALIFIYKGQKAENLK